MRGVNKVIIIGLVGADPEVRSMPSGTAVVNLSLATNESWKDKETGERKERAEWHRVVLFGKLAEIAGQYVKKGDPLYLEGRIQTRKWQTEDGQDRYTTEIVANEMRFLGGGRGGDGQHQQPAQQGQQPGNAYEALAPQQGQQPQQGAGGDYDDDIPF